MPADEARDLPTPPDVPDPDATRVAPPAATIPGVVAIPGYDLMPEIARGGMGVVYRARDLAFDREVAVKVMLPGMLAAEFVREARITGRLPHPGIPPVHALGALADGRPFLAMKLIKGDTLDRVLKARADLSADRGKLLAAFEQMCQAVGYAHSQGIVHRDLKPSNVMVGAFGEVQVMDWGLAKEALSAEPKPGPGAPNASADVAATVAGQIKGTPAYMAPEQARGEPVDARADVFALGGILAAILTGHPPFAGDGVLDTIIRAGNAELHEAFGRLDGCGADAELVGLAKWCLSARAVDRPGDGEQAAAAVAAYRAGVDARLHRAEQEAAAAEARAEEEANTRREAEAREREQRRRRRAQLALTAAVALLVAAAGVFAWWQDHRASAARVEEGRRRAATDQEATAALAEMDALRAQGDREVENPPRWRLTLAAARAAHRRAAAAVEAGPASDEVREKVQAGAARLDREESDWATADAAEKSLIALVDALSKGPAAVPESDRQLEARFERIGIPLRGPPEVAADAVRRHRLRYQLTALLLTAGQSRAAARSPLLTPQLSAAVRQELHPLLPALMKRAERTQRSVAKGADGQERVREEVTFDRDTIAAQLREGPGRDLSSTEIVCLSFHEYKDLGWYNADLRYLVEVAYQRNPSNLYALVWRAIDVTGRRGGESRAAAMTPGGTPTEFVEPLRPRPGVTRPGRDAPGERTPEDDDAKATGVLTAATGARPEVPLFWLLSGMSLAHDGYHRTAAEYFREAVRLDPTSRAAHDGLANALLNGDQRLAALDAYRTLIRQFGHRNNDFGTDPRVRAAQAALRRACVEPPQLAKDKRDRTGPTPEEKLELRREALGWLREWLKDQPTPRDLFVVEHDPAFACVFEPALGQVRPEMSPEEVRHWDQLLDDIRTASRRSGRKFSYGPTGTPQQLPPPPAPPPHQPNRP